MPICAPVRHVRVFTEIQSGLEAGRTGGPRPTDEDRLEFHQVFAEFRTGSSPHLFSLRVGRQEVAFGSGRLISASEGRNVRQSFDAIRPIVRLGCWTWNAMLAKLVAVEPGAFDDSHVPGHTFGGLGFIRTSPKRPGAGASGYYLRLHRRAARFDQGTAPEIRHTLGARTWGGWAEVDYNYEAIFQWGSFGRRADPGMGDRDRYGLSAGVIEVADPHRHSRRCDDGGSTAGRSGAADIQPVVSGNRVFRSRRSRRPGKLDRCDAERA